MMCPFSDLSKNIDIKTAIKNKIICKKKAKLIPTKLTLALTLKTLTNAKIIVVLNDPTISRLLIIILKP